MNRNLNRRIHPIAEADGLSPKKPRKIAIFVLVVIILQVCREVHLKMFSVFLMIICKGRVFRFLVKGGVLLNMLSLRVRFPPRPQRLFV